MHRCGDILAPDPDRRPPVLLAALLGLGVGLVVGALGGGGGVLAVPALVYVLGLSAQDATTSSVVIVGIAAVTGVLARARGGLVRWRTGFALGAVGVPAAALGTLLNQRVAEPVLLLSFSALTVLAALAMLVDAHRAPPDEPDAGAPAGPGGGTATTTRPAVRTAVEVVVSGAAIGFLTGFLGVGGGFLVVPVLVIVLRMPMAHAVGTSLLVITVNAVAALATRAGVAEFDWAVLVPFTAAAVLGAVAGKWIAERLPGPVLTRAFAVLLLLVGAFVAGETLLVG
jgi:uncharacterized membrane protein YfcA